MLSIKKEDLSLIDEVNDTEFGFTANDNLYVIRDEYKDVVGFSNLSFENDTCYVIELEILYDYRGMGYGSNFINQLFNDFKLKMIYGKANFSAVGFWNSVGATIEVPCDTCDNKKFCEYDEDEVCTNDYTGEFTILIENIG